MGLVSFYALIQMELEQRLGRIECTQKLEKRLEKTERRLEDTEKKNVRMILIEKIRRRTYAVK